VRILSILLCSVFALFAQAPRVINVDMIWSARYIVTEDSARRVIENGAVAIRGARIIAIGQRDAIERAYTSATRLDQPNAILAPGLINTHTHAAMSLFRGIADDLKLQDWLEKYIFPGGVLPSLQQIGAAIEHLFVVIDLHNIGPHYDKTLCAWYDNFHANWPTPQTPEQWRFYRMWKYYLLCCAGAFRSRSIQVWQFVLSTRGVPEGYVTQR